MRLSTALSLSALMVVGGAGGAQSATQGLEATTVQRFAQLALDCIPREYPNKIAHVLNDDADVLPPRDLTPAFFGCYDWHSAVHAHWLLARLAKTVAGGDFVQQARAAIDRSIQPERIAAEARYLEAPGRVSFERPYGLAWLLQLAAELREWEEDPKAQWWAFTLGPLERAAVERLSDWLPKLSHPIRSGEHSQTAFAFSLIFDWARVAGEKALENLVRTKIREFYLRDLDCPIAYEPSGQDFLSPCLAEADLMRRILPPPQYAAWLGAFLPGIPLDGSAGWLEPAVVTDPGDPKLAHLDGLNLSRAWMLEGMAAGLPPEDPRVEAIQAAAERHARTGLRSVTGQYYEGGHWLGSFATYLVTGRGLPPLTEGKQKDSRR